MRSKHYNATILIAEDDEDDRLLLQEALNEAQISESIYFVKDGDEVIDYMFRRNQYAKPNLVSLPELLLLDWNMPKTSGREVLKTMKANPLTRHIPVVVLTTSNSLEDISLAYDLGASSFIVKPPRFDTLVYDVSITVAYWLGVVTLPREKLG